MTTAFQRLFFDVLSRLTATTGAAFYDAARSRGIPREAAEAWWKEREKSMGSNYESKGEAKTGQNKRRLSSVERSAERSGTRGTLRPYAETQAP
jgi:hypothetical protein